MSNVKVTKVVIYINVLKKWLLIRTKFQNFLNRPMYKFHKIVKFMIHFFKQNN